MKLLNFSLPDGEVRIGVAVGHGIVDISSRLDIPADMSSLIASFDRFGKGIAALAKTRPADYLLADVTVLAPVLRPGKILGIGLNYADHIKEGGHPAPSEQMWFSKAVTSVQSPFGDIVLPAISEQLDYEAELVFIIGTRCRHVAVQNARQVIFGYCAGNDVSVRDWQRKPTQHMLGKSFDTHAPFGPWIVTADEIGDPHEMGIRCWVNGELRQDSNTRELVFDCFDQVAYLSQVMTLEPGDVIFTGTPGGVGAAFKPPRFLKAGDKVRVELDKIGMIESTVIPEAM